MNTPNSLILYLCDYLIITKFTIMPQKNLYLQYNYGNQEEKFPITLLLHFRSYNLHPNSFASSKPVFTCTYTIILYANTPHEREIIINRKFWLAI